MDSNFILIVLFTLAAVAFGGGMLALSIILPKLLGDTARKRGKLDPYECGVDPLSSSRARFSVKFYVVALLFILFDIEAVFLLPWAVAYRDLIQVPGMAWTVLIGGLVFIAMLVLGLIYEWLRGGMDWS